jgi:ATP-dependent DNA helicase RecG
MVQNDLACLLDQLIARWEDEVVEFKRGKDSFSTSDLGKYLSALSNEANLRGRERAWIVFGVDESTRNVVGTSFKEDPEHLQSTKKQMWDGTSSITFRNIHELQHSDGRVIMFEVPAAPRGMPITWNGHSYGRAHESLIALPQDKLDEIRNQTVSTDWTAQVVAGATIDDLDPVAITTARERFVEKHAPRITQAEVASWSDSTFLDRAKVTQNGSITRAALLLLGKKEAAWRLSPNPAEITWSLRGEEQAYEHFYPPFLLASSAVYARIRNVQIRILPQDQLLPHEVSKYDQSVVLEALHNCIAHQDYSRNGRIVVTEFLDRLTFDSEGGFFDGDPTDYATGLRSTPRLYRNNWLVQAMAELNMIDQMGYGIHRIYEAQRRRFFPLPDYDLGNHNSVKLTIHGRVVDPAYSRLLMQKSDLDLVDVVSLDRVQKKLPITNDVIKHLRRRNLIEGRKPNFHVSAQVAAATATMADYVRTRAQDDEFYAKLLTDYLAGAGRATRREVDQLLIDKLSDALTPEQRTKKIANLLTKLRRQGLIVNAGQRAAPQWMLAERKVQ